MKLTSIMLNERSQTQKITYCVIPLRQNSSVMLKVRIGYLWVGGLCLGLKESFWVQAMLFLDLGSGYMDMWYVHLFCMQSKFHIIKCETNIYFMTNEITYVKSFK